MSGRLGITDIHPVVSGGVFPARAVPGEVIPVSATVFREGHDKLGANVVFSAPATPGVRRGVRPPFVRMRPGVPGTDRWHATVTPDRPGRWSYVVEAWSDPLGTWKHAVEAKVEAGQGVEDLSNDLESGAQLLTRAVKGVPKEDRQRVVDAAATLRDKDLDLAHRIAPALEPSLRELLERHPVRELVTKSRRHFIWVDRPQATFSSWYELFPRSTGGWDAEGKPVHGTFRTTMDALPRVAEMGFDVVYFPPIHPVGEVNRKGRNNTLVAGPDDVGSPWAIGSRFGGHDAIEPKLGTLADFDALVARAQELGMEVALDLALQCAPDHPWVATHPEWFTVKPDGSIAYAENPPKKYQDIYPVNFDDDPEGIYAEVLRVVLHWVDHGVKIFRVDNPHTKPVNFWHWLIWEVKREHPEVLFLSEAFTRPAMLKGLAERGFTQSYTYFTWRTAKWEIEEFGRDLASTGHFVRPNFFVNTPDILHASLQYGGPPMFKVRAVLASTMSPTWGVYSGFELFEHVALKPGSEEYLDSEKFQLRPRDFAAARDEGRSLEPFIGQLNQIRRSHPALQVNVRELSFHHVDNENIVVYSRRDPATGDTVLVVCSLDSQHTQIGTVSLDLPALGFDWYDRFAAHDELTGHTYDWGQSNYVELDPYHQPAHILSVRRY